MKKLMLVACGLPASLMLGCGAASASQLFTGPTAYGDCQTAAADVDRAQYWYNCDAEGVDSGGFRSYSLDLTPKESEPDVRPSTTSPSTPDSNDFLGGFLSGLTSGSSFSGQ